MLKINLDTAAVHSGRDDSDLRVVGVAQVSAGQYGWGFPMHAHNDMADLVLITDGEGFFTTWCSENLPTRKGDLLVHNQDTLHAERTNPQNPLEEICISLQGVRIDGLPENHIISGHACPLVQTGDAYPLFYSLFDYVRRICIERPAGYEVLCRDCARTILSLIRHQLDCSRQHGGKERGFPALMDLVHYLDGNYHRNIRLEDLSRKFHFSPYYLSHKFKEEMGVSINLYLTNRRVGEAKKLLIYTNLPISVIGQRVGYDTLNHFYAVFKKHIGVAPGKLREIYLSMG